ncbi:MAG: hypothetical protein ACLVFM_12430 [Blautia faecis]
MISRSDSGYAGQAEKVTIRKDRTLIVGGAGDKAAINERLDMLHTMLKMQRMSSM